MHVSNPPISVTLFSFLERRYIAKEYKRVAPLSAYPFLTACLLTSTTLGNMSLNYINYPTKVVFRSCKLIPTMMISSFMHRRVFRSVEYFCALSICLGLIFFAAADWQTTPSFHPFGLVLVSLSTFADAINPNAQEKIFKMGASRMEVTFFNNIFTFIVMTFATLVSGDFMAVYNLARTNSRLSRYIIIYICISYVAVSSYISVIKKFGGVAAVLVATARKVLTLILSFLLFPKIFSWYYVSGGSLVMAGISIASSLDAKKSTQDKGQNLHNIHHRRQSIGIKNKDQHGSETYISIPVSILQTDEESLVTHTHSS